VPTYNSWSFVTNLPSPPLLSGSVVPTVELTRSLTKYINTETSDIYTPSTDFDPTSIAGCQLWLDSADTSTLSLSGTTVTSWADKSGKGYNATAYPNGGTITYTSGIAGVNVVAQSVTTPAYLSSPIPAGTFNTALYIFVVYKNTGKNNYDALISRGRPGTWNGPLDPYNTTRYISDGSIGFSSYNLYNESMSLFDIGIHYAGNTVAEWSNGSANTYTGQPGALVNYDNSSGPLLIGTRGDFVTCFTGYFYEILVYNTALSTADRQKIEGYLAWKWNLQTQLSSNPLHPYLSLRPLVWDLLVNVRGNKITTGSTGTGPLVAGINDYFINTSTGVIYKNSQSGFSPVTTLGSTLTSGAVAPSAVPSTTTAYYINTSSGQIYNYTSGAWSVVLGGSRILGTSPYTNSLLTTTLTTSATALYEVGPVVTTASSKLLIVANLSLFTGTATANTYQMLVGRYTATGGGSGSSTNIISNQQEIIMPFTTGASYVMASVNTSASGQAVNLNGIATDIPGAGTFYYRIWATASADNSANSTLTASLNVVQM